MMTIMLGSNKYSCFIASSPDSRGEFLAFLKGDIENDCELNPVGVGSLEVMTVALDFGRLDFDTCGNQSIASLGWLEEEIMIVVDGVHGFFEFLVFSSTLAYP